MSVPQLDPSKFVVIPDVPVVDTFDLDTGTDSFAFSPEFLARCVENGNRRERETGDLCPIVLGRTATGHTVAGLPETMQPKVVGYARNWKLGRLLNTDRVAAHADFWVYKEDLAEVKKYPRRSAEVWRGRAEIDPISLLGATTPHRDLGMLPVSLSRPAEIPVRFTRDENLTMPDDDKNGTVPKATPGNEDLLAEMRKISAALSDVVARLDKMAGGTGGEGQDPTGAAPGAGADATAPGAAAPAGPGAAGGGDDELEKLIAELEAGGGDQPGAGAADPRSDEEKPTRKEDAPDQNFGYAGGQNTFVPGGKSKFSREDQLALENAQLKVQLARQELKGKLEGMAKDRGVHFENIDEEVAELLALPEAMQKTRLSRIEKQYKQLPGGGGMIPAVADARGNAAAPNLTPEKNAEIIQLARREETTYDVAFFKTMGYHPGRPPVTAR
jgi:hypothetical protein